MEFQPLYYASKLRIVNPYATVGVVTLWSSVDFVFETFKNAGINLSRETSRIAVLGTLYGGGFREFLRNLLFNPQIEMLLVFGSELYESLDILNNFFEKGVEPYEGAIEYDQAHDSAEVKPVRVIGTRCVIDNLVSREMFNPVPKMVRIPGINLEAVRKASVVLERHRPSKHSVQRINIELPKVKIVNYPSNPRAHTIIEETPSEAWRQLIHRLFRFGKRVSIRKGERIELQNVKVVVESPRIETAKTISECGFRKRDFIEYQKMILSSRKRSDVNYSYGNRIRKYFGKDLLNDVVDNLREGLDNRKAYIALWDSRNDLRHGNAPCLVSLFFRKIEAKLQLTATFRTHNAAQAWLENFYGLMSIQDYVSKRVKAEKGAITVISHSISLNPDTLEKAKTIHDRVSQRNRFREDPNGYFIISTEGEDIVLQHLHEGAVIGQYRGRKPEKIQYELYRNLAISDINHAIYIGRQLEKAYLCIKNNEPYRQQ